MKSFGHWFNTVHLDKEEQQSDVDDAELEEQDTVSFTELLNELGMSEKDIETYYGDYE